jgi:4-amino-4-deoxy-L-arabinose transferase-like glycosyltransferase
MLTYLEAGLDRLAPLTATSARSIPMVLGTLAIVAGFLLGRRFFGEAGGLWTATFMAADNLLFLAARTVRPEILVTLSITLSLWCAINAAEAQRHRAMWVCLGALSGALGIWSHPNGLIGLASIGLFWLFYCRWDRSQFVRVTQLALATAVFVTPLVLWIVYFDGPNHFASFKHNWLGRYGHTAHVSRTSIEWVSTLLSAEWHGRYTDYVQYPYRLHIALIVVALTVGSLLRGPARVRALAALVLFQLLFFIFGNNSNPSVRYLATLAPLVALLGAFWLIQFWHTFLNTRSRIAGVGAALLVLALGASQLAGNVLSLWKSRNADYERVSKVVDSAIPTGSVVYGGIFWWLGLRQHTLVPYIRTPWQQAIREWRPSVVIMDDWVMTGADDGNLWRSLRTELGGYLHEHGHLLRNVDGGFYGHLKIYAVEHEIHKSSTVAP